MNARQLREQASDCEHRGEIAAADALYAAADEIERMRLREVYRRGAYQLWFTGPNGETIRVDLMTDQIIQVALGGIDIPIDGGMSLSNVTLQAFIGGQDA